MLLNNEIALVTGGSRGIGRAIALELGKNGATVVATATSESGANNISNYMKENGIDGYGAVLDVSENESIKQVLNEMADRVGAPSIVVNNAGITRDNLILRMKDEEWNEIINTNLGSIFRISKACLRAMIKARKGRIINIASVVALTGNPGQTNYAAAKAGILGFTKSLAQEIGSRGITVNTVAPGFIDTDMTKALAEEQRTALVQHIPLNRLGQPEEIAAAVVFLASSAASYITGETIHVNGGMYMP